MGRSNVCVNGPYEGLYYIDNDDFHVYRRIDDLDDWPETRLMRDLSYFELTGGGWVYDEEGTMTEESDVLDCFKEGFCLLFPDFSEPQSNTYIRKGVYGDIIRVLLENELFYVCVEDNEWSIALELIQKEDPYDNHLEGLQKGLYKKYLEGMKMVLLDRLPSIGTYAGAWISGIIRREEI